MLVDVDADVKVNEVGEKVPHGAEGVMVSAVPDTVGVLVSDRGSDVGTVV